MSSPAERSLAANIAAATRWATCPDRTAATKPARDGLRARFAREVDPDGTLTPVEREYRVDQMMRAHMLRMSIASKKARAERASTQAATGEAADRPASERATQKQARA